MSDYKIAHLDAIHVTTAANTALTDSNKIEALRTCTFATAIEHVELRHLNNNDGYSDHEAVWTSVSGTLEGDVKKGSATQEVLTTALENRTPFYLHVIEDAAAAAGERMGTLYHLTIESGEEPREAGALVTFSYGVLVKGKPTPILAPSGP